MKILQRDEIESHYSAVLKGGLAGGLVGLAAGLGSVATASRLSSVVRKLTLPMKAYLCTSAGTFGAVVNADKASKSFEISRCRGNKQPVPDGLARDETMSQHVWRLGAENKLVIIHLSWIASMIGSLVLIGRNPYFTISQKLAQARVYAQGFTVAVLLATAMLGNKADRRLTNREGYPTPRVPSS
ncbi:hypothetical protein F5884DRAFT_527573 [Xylogone sp. PMI_703]|nr:hypothetical protein F5884DRAFT_527573 [Xylogone sp. PMI_703]